MPTQAEMAEHKNNGHAQYRDWCPDCVKGFRREWAQKKSSSERLAPLISCDYVYKSPTGVFALDELSEEERVKALKVLVAECGATKSPFAHAASRRGADQDGDIVEQFKQHVLWLGHAKVMIRSDNEPAMVQFIETVLAAQHTAGFSSAGEGSVPYDPPADQRRGREYGQIAQEFSAHQSPQLGETDPSQDPT